MWANLRSSTARLVEPPAWGAGPGARLLVLLGLTGFAITQPVLAMLGEEPTFFTFRGATPAEIVAFSLLLAVVPPLVLWLVDLAAGWLRPRAGWWIHLATVATLLFLTGVQVLKQAGVGNATAQTLVATTGALAGVVVYTRYETIATWARFTAVLPVIAVGSFVFLSPTSGLIDPPGRAPVDRAGAPADVPNLLVVMLDELPTEMLMTADRTIDATRFPNLAQFADESTWYRRYTSRSQSTTLAVPAALSSAKPKNQPAIAANYPDTLFSLLAPTHKLSVVETATSLCDPQMCPPVATASRDGFPALVRKTIDLWETRVIPGRDTAGAFDDFAQERAPAPSGVFGRERLLAHPQDQADLLATIVPSDAAQFWYLHLMLPHAPWRTYPDGRDYDVGPINDPNVYPFDVDNASGSWIAALTEQRLLLQLSYTDALVGQLFDALRDQGLYDDTVVVLTADHGVSLRPDTPRRSPVEENLDTLAFVPLLLKDAGQRTGAVDDTNVQSVDLVPTIADLVGVEMTWDPVGVPIGSEEQLQRGEEREFYDFGAGGGGLIPAEFQGIFTYDGAELAPDGTGRWVGPIEPGDDPIAGLLDRLEVDDLLGRSVSDVAVGALDTAPKVDQMGPLTTPPEVAPPGIVSGRLDDHDQEGDEVILVEVNGRIVTASPLITYRDQPNRFFALLPPDALRPDGNEIRLGLLRAGEVWTLPDP